MLEPPQWPVVITTACANAAAKAFGFNSVTEARQWVEKLSEKHGTTTKTLPKRFQGRRSKSGYFRVVPGMFVLPLASDNQNRPQWIATHLLAYADPDQAPSTLPLTAAGWELVRQVDFTVHAVRRFQERCGGNPDLVKAREELLRTLVPTVCAQLRPPAWSKTRPADFYLVAGKFDQYCLPCRISVGGKPAFEATTCLHRASALFHTTGNNLWQKCALSPAIAPISGREHQALKNGFAFGGHLNWHKPSWITADYREDTWWITFPSRVAVAVEWQPENAEKPLLIKKIVDQRSWFIRTWDNLRFRN